MQDLTTMTLLGRRLAFRAMAVAAGVVAYTREAALVAAIDMTAQRRRSALLDSRHHLQLAEAHMTGVGQTPRRSEAAEDIRHLDRRT